MDFFPRRSAVVRFLWLFLLFILPLTSADVDKKYIKRTSFESKLTPFQFFEDSETALVAEPRKGKVHISKDAGASWDEVEDLQHGFAIVLSPNDNKVAIVMTTGDTHYITRDQGKKWTSFKTKGMTPSPAAPFSFHASDNKKIIMNVHGDSERAAYYTTDGFKSDPELLRSRTQQCMWAKERVPFESGHDRIDKNRILCIAPKEAGIKGILHEHLVYSDDYFKYESEAKIGDGRAGSGFVSMVSATKYILAAKKGEHTTEMAMYTTTDGSEWHRALFGHQKIDADGYTVMESTDYSIRVDVMEGGGGPFSPAPMGNLFGSDSNGTYFTSLQEHTNRNSFGFVDYERLDNIQGVALANIVANPEAVLDRNEPKQLQTKITFDDGRTFQHLRGQRDDRKGDLNLHGYSEMRNQGKVFSNRGAPGLLMGIGNLGDDLHDYEESNLWVSQNGGEDWFFGYEGPHKYEFADSGSILVAVSDTVATNHIKYSLDYGEHWEKLKLIEDDDDKFRAGIFTTITDSTSSKVLLTALTGRGDDAKLWVYSIDFELLDLKKCDKKDDFETWHAREHDDGPGCVMGQQQSFRRKKQKSECSVDKEFKEAEPDFKPCPCTEADFECDTGYVRSEDRKKCLPEKGLLAPKGKCKNPKDTFMGRSGFRHIPGNACKKNEVYDKMLDDVERTCNDLNNSPTADGIKSTIKPWDGDLFREFRYLERPSFSDGSEGSDDYNDKDETILMLTEGRTAWKTHDHGKTWKQLEDIEGALFIYPNVHEHRDAYIITVSGDVFYTTNRGQDFRSFKAPNPPNDQGLPVLRFHETRRNWLIWTGCDSESGPCYPTAHRSLKRGGDWEKLVDDAGTCEFVWQEGRNTSEKLVFCARDDGRAKNLVASEDWFETDRVVFNDIANFATMSEFIIVATREHEQASLTLNASIDAQTFAPARWPSTLAPTPHEGFDGYTVLDSSSHSIFLHITVNGRREREYGTIVKSNSNGTNFVTSLNFVNRNTAGFVDFEKVQAIEGTALSNVVANHEEVEKIGASKKLQTRITHNDGADWDYLVPPSQDNNGDDYDCALQRKRKPECALHLHGYTERRSPDDTYSSPSAVGLVLGIGNVGSELGRKRDGDTFVSRDGGLTWHTAQKGQYMWEFGDQGSIVVLVEERAPTNTILYSLDEGRNFDKYQFTEKESEEYEISDLSTVPSDGSLNFLLWGRRPSGKREAVTINIDFRGAFDRQCNFKEGEHDEEDSDYELWEPEHPFQDNNCLFGHHAQYHRKKATSTDCYNGPRIERFHATRENCSCTAKDFECDYNYQRDQAGVCIKAGEERDPKEECRANPYLKVYHPVSGYRRIPGNTCQGGKELDYVYPPLPCPGYEEEYDERYGTSRWLVFFIVIICIMAAGGIGWFIYHRLSAGKFGRIALGDDAGPTTRMRVPLPNFDTGSPIVRYPVMAVSALAAAVLAIPMIVVGGGRWVRDRFPGTRKGGYSRLGGDGPAWRGSGSRTYRSRESFGRGRDWTGQASDESDLLGDDSDEEA